MAKKKKEPKNKSVEHTLSEQRDARLKSRIWAPDSVNVNQRSFSKPQSVALAATQIRLLRRVSLCPLRVRFTIIKSYANVMRQTNRLATYLTHISNYMIIMEVILKIAVWPSHIMTNSISLKYFNMNMIKISIKESFIVCDLPIFHTCSIC